MSRYAAQTEVSPDRSKIEIEKTLMRYGAEQFMYGSSPDKTMIAFKANERFVRFTLPLPDPDDRSFNKTPTGRARTKIATQKEYTQEIRRRWRALSLSIKAKLEAVETGITTFEQEFMAHIVLPNQQTVGEAMIPQIELAYENKEMPKALPGI